MSAHYEEIVSVPDSRALIGPLWNSPLHGVRLMVTMMRQASKLHGNEI
jgi:tRNA G26 N,N-dimethylase Trm1